MPYDVYPPMPVTIRIRDAVAALRVSRDTISRWIAAGTIRAVRIGGVVLIPRTEIDRILGIVPGGCGDRPGGPR